jgi:hypothetical protein
VNGNDGTRTTGHGRRAGCWPPTHALLALGGWLVVSPLVLATTRDTPDVVSAITSGLVLVVLASWAHMGRNRVAPLVIVLAFGVWLLLAPAMWEFGDGADTPGLVPITPGQVTEPTRAAVARAEWSSVLAGLLALALAAWMLLAARRCRQGWSAPSTDSEHPRHADVAGDRR